MKIGVINYGVGNLGSVCGALDVLGANYISLSNATEIGQVDALILPGVGGFTECKKLLDEGGWTELIQVAVVSEKKPLLGICLGMQLLASFGKEGADSVADTPGLGLIPGCVTSLKALGVNQRIPHVGWNSILVQTEIGLLKGIPSGTDFYFVHSYGFIADNPNHVLAVVDYDVKIPVVIKHENVWGTQFHPEKSSRAGFKMLKNFMANYTC